MTQSDDQVPEQAYVQTPEQTIMPTLMAVALGGGSVPPVPGALVLDAVPGCPRPEADDACNATLLDKTDAGYRQHHCARTERLDLHALSLGHSCVCGASWQEVSTP